MKRNLAFGCLLLLAGCDTGAWSKVGLGQPDPIAQAKADVERLTIQIKEEKKALHEDATLASYATGEDKIKLQAIVQGDHRRLNQFEDRLQATEIRIRQLLAERRASGQ